MLPPQPRPGSGRSRTVRRVGGRSALRHTRIPGARRGWSARGGCRGSRRRPRAATPGCRRCGNPLAGDVEARGRRPSGREKRCRACVSVRRPRPSRRTRPRRESGTPPTRRRARSRPIAKRPSSGAGGECERDRARCATGGSGHPGARWSNRAGADRCRRIASALPRERWGSPASRRSLARSSRGISSKEMTAGRRAPGGGSAKRTRTGASTALRSTVRASHSFRRGERPARTSRSHTSAAARSTWQMM